MGERSFNKYANLTKLFWLLFRPLFVKAAASSDSDIDDEMIKVADAVMNSGITYDDIK